MKQMFYLNHPPGQLNVTRRRVLLALASLVPVSGLAIPLVAQAVDNDDAFLKVSRIITGDATLSAGISQRMLDLLKVRIAGFAEKLDDLSKALGATIGARDQMLSALSDSQVKFALAIAQPWYLGYVGKPSNFILKDDAAFVTFLEAQAWSKIAREVPRPTYPGADAGWWDVAPPGVAAPPMPEAITQWTFHPGGPAQILAPDPKWKAYATADHASIDDARGAKPGGH
jgi:hypothetical protein